MRKQQTSVLLCGAAVAIALLAARAFTASATPSALPRRAIDPKPAPIAATPETPSETDIGSGEAKGAEEHDVTSCAHGDEMDRLVGAERAKGSMAVSVDARGRRYVLDPERRRVVRYDAQGNVEATIPMTVAGAEAIAVGRDGSMAVLDRFGDESVKLYDDKGRALGSLPLAGEGIDDLNDVTSVFVEGSDVYVQREHGSLVLVGNTSGAPAGSRAELSGKPGQDGSSLLTGAITDEETGRAFVASVDRASGEHRFSRELHMTAPIASIALIDADKAGTIYVAFEVAPSPDEVGVVLVCLDPASGSTIGTTTLPNLPEDASRVLTVAATGGVLATVQTGADMTFERYDCR